MVSTFGTYNSAEKPPSETSEQQLSSAPAASRSNKANDEGFPRRKPLIKSEKASASASAPEATKSTSETPQKPKVETRASKSYTLPVVQDSSTSSSHDASKSATAKVAEKSKSDIGSANEKTAPSPSTVSGETCPRTDEARYEALRQEANHLGLLSAEVQCV